MSLESQSFIHYISFNLLKIYALKSMDDKSTLSGQIMRVRFNLWLLRISCTLINIFIIHSAKEEQKKSINKSGTRQKKSVSIFEIASSMIFHQQRKKRSDWSIADGRLHTLIFSFRIHILSGQIRLYGWLNSKKQKRDRRTDTQKTAHAHVLLYFFFFCLIDKRIKWNTHIYRVPLK